VMKIVNTIYYGGGLFILVCFYTKLNWAELLVISSWLFNSAQADYKIMQDKRIIRGLKNQGEMKNARINELLAQLDSEQDIEVELGKCFKLFGNYFWVEEYEIGCSKSCIKLKDYGVNEARRSKIFEGKEIK
jgi:hypothetical protein